MSTDEPKDEKVRVRVTDRRRVDPPGGPGPEAPEETAQEDPAAEVERVRAEAAAYLDDLRRLKAEFDNYRKRMLKEQTAIVELASTGVVEHLLPVLDNFELALLAADRTEDYAALVKGVELVYGELLGVLRKEGLERIDALGKPFDPELHEAVMRTEDADASAELVVVDEMRPGYRIAGRVVRPAMVKVGPRT